MDKPSTKHETPRMIFRRGCKILLALTGRNVLHFLQLFADNKVCVFLKPCCIHVDYATEQKFCCEKRLVKISLLKLAKIIIRSKSNASVTKTFSKPSGEVSTVLKVLGQKCVPNKTDV